MKKPNTKAQHRQAVKLALAKWRDMPLFNGKCETMQGITPFKHRVNAENFADKYGLSNRADCTLCTLYQKAHCRGCPIARIDKRCTSSGSDFTKYYLGKRDKTSILNILIHEKTMIDRDKYSEYLYRFINKHSREDAKKYLNALYNSGRLYSETFRLLYNYHSKYGDLRILNKYIAQLDNNKVDIVPVSVGEYYDN
jgi:hypothetical protein